MSKTKEEALFPEPTEVVVGYGKNQKTFEVGPLARKKYKKMFKMVGETIQEFLNSEAKGAGAIDFDNLEKSIPLILVTLGDKIGEVYSLVLGVDVEWIDDNTLPQQEVELITAIFEQNDFESIVKNFKKMIAKTGLMEQVKKLSSKKSVQNTK